MGGTRSAGRRKRYINETVARASTSARFTNVELRYLTYLSRPPPSETTAP